LGVFNPRNATDKWPELDLSHSRVRWTCSLFLWCTMTCKDVKQ
jgi:hypothetical protein